MFLITASYAAAGSTAAKGSVVGEMSLAEGLGGVLAEGGVSRLLPVATRLKWGYEKLSPEVSILAAKTAYGWIHSGVGNRARGVSKVDV